jgi:hypothetical protein
VAAPLTVSVAAAPSQMMEGPPTLIFSPGVMVNDCCSVLTQPVTASVTCTVNEYVAAEYCGSEIVTTDESALAAVMRAKLTEPVQS